jgi:CHAD domain-containing protein
VAQIEDRYLDTAEGGLRAQGYACRLRQEDHRTLGSLKGLGQAAGAVHRRPELEVELPAPLLPAEWPPGPARDLALHLCGSRPLLPVLTIRQTRHRRPVLTGGGAVAILSLDDVCICHDAQLLGSCLEVEAELLPGQAEEDLERLAAVIQEEWRLEPQPESKFERAVALLQALPAAKAGRRRLDVEERAAVDRLAQQAEVVARRARLLQAWDDGLSRQETAGHAGLSDRRVRHWLRAFGQVRLAIFPQRALREAMEPESAAPATTAPGGRVQPRRKQGPGLTRRDTMGQAAVKVLAFHHERMLRHEPGTRLGDDIEALHDMRVATRRMRAALRVFEAAVHPRALASLGKGLRRTGRALGPVRDLDVFREKTLRYCQSLPEGQRGGLVEFLDVIEARREAAREQMIAYLDGQKYARFKANMEGFLSGAAAEGTPGCGDAVGDVAPIAVQERLADVLAFDPQVSLPDPPPERLHELRIVCKWLRYTLEFFQEVLGPGTRRAIAEVVALQDHLGALQDAVVAGEILRDYLATGTWGTGSAAPASPGQAPLAPGVQAYLEANMADFRHLVDTFAPAWQRIAGAEFQRLISACLRAKRAGEGARKI